MVRMDSSPKVDQYVGVSTMINPVTHTDETVVNSAVTNPAEAPLSVATGSISSAVPIATATANPATTAAGRRSNTSTGERLLVIPLGTPRRLTRGLHPGPRQDEAATRPFLSLLSSDFRITMRTTDLRSHHST
jgi:hypothetical protein